MNAPLASWNRPLAHRSSCGQAVKIHASSSASVRPTQPALLRARQPRRAARTGGGAVTSSSSPAPPGRRGRQRPARAPAPPASPWPRPRPRPRSRLRRPTPPAARRPGQRLRRGGLARRLGRGLLGADARQRLGRRRRRPHERVAAHLLHDLQLGEFVRLDAVDARQRPVAVDRVGALGRLVQVERDARLVQPPLHDALAIEQRHLRDGHGARQRADRILHGLAPPRQHGETIQPAASSAANTAPSDSLR